MTYKVDISIPALQDAESAFLWIRDFNRDNAKAWYEGLLEAIFTLENSPERCAFAPERKAIGREVRHLIYGKRKQQYRVFFEVMESEKIVRVYRIRHSAKQWITKEEFEEGKPPKE